MKKLMIFTMMMFLTNVSFGQITTAEPELAGQVAVLNADGTTTLLQKESATIKTKSSKWGMIPIPGSGLLDKAKVQLVIKGKEAPISVQGGTVTLLVKATSNELDPKQVFGIMKLNVEKKSRTFLMGDYSLIGGSNTTLSYSNVPFKVEKYGDSSYVVTIENAEAGEYAVNTDFTQLATLSVK